MLKGGCRCLGPYLGSVQSDGVRNRHGERTWGGEAWPEPAGLVGSVVREEGGTRGRPGVGPGHGWSLLPGLRTPTPPPSLPSSLLPSWQGLKLWPLEAPSLDNLSSVSMSLEVRSHSQP